MSVTVRRVTSLSDCDTARAIAGAVWGSDAACSTPQMSVHANYGGVVLLAEVDAQPVGFLFSFPALYQGEWVLWSHETAVLPEYLHQGIGLRLKQVQREFARELGYKKIAWTYDPLVSRNAHFNLNKLGARVTEYKVNAYGADEGDLVNRGIETDRFIAVWDVDAFDSHSFDHTGSGGSTYVALAVTEDGRPVEWASDGPVTRPGDKVADNVTDNPSSGPNANVVNGQTKAASIVTQIPLEGPPTHDLGVAWRESFRNVALGLFAANYQPVAFRRDDICGEYLWRKC